jgi:hypothetical protein
MVSFNYNDKNKLNGDMGGDVAMAVVATNSDSYSSMLLSPIRCPNPILILVLTVVLNSNPNPSPNSNPTLILSQFRLEFTTMTFK